MTRWKTEIPNEEEEQMKLARYLDANGYCWCHVPNEGKHKVQYRAKQKKMGLKPGVPDVLIFDRVGEISGMKPRGVAIELKRKKGGQLQESQEKWLNKLKYNNWLTKVAYGADDAIEWLERIFQGG